MQHMWILANIMPIEKKHQPRHFTYFSSLYLPKHLRRPYFHTAQTTFHTSLLDRIIKETTDTTLHICSTIATGLYQKHLLARTITIALNMSKAFDTVNIRKLIKNSYTSTYLTTISRDAKLSLSKKAFFHPRSWTILPNMHNS